MVHLISRYDLFSFFLFLFRKTGIFVLKMVPDTSWWIKDGEISPASVLGEWQVSAKPWTLLQTRVVLEAPPAQQDLAGPPSSHDLGVPNHSGSSGSLWGVRSPHCPPLHMGSLASIWPLPCLTPMFSGPFPAPPAACSWLFTLSKCCRKMLLLLNTK